MHLNSSTLAELVGLVLIALAIGALFGPWWGIGAAGVELVIYGIALDEPVDDDGDA